MGNDEIAAAHAELAARQLAGGAHGAAFESLATALGLAPGADALWAQFSDLIRYFNLRHPVPPRVRELLSRALEHRAVDPASLVRPVTTLALSQPDPWREPLLLRLLEDVVIRDEALERLVVETRRRMLDEDLPLPVMNAVAHQCFNAEYVYAERAEELARIPQAPKDARDLARHAAYRPLGEATAGESALVRRQVLEPREERRLAAALPSLSGAQSEVSARVQALYEEHPYPRWVRMPSVFPPAVLPAPLARAPRILVAGCGTGQNAIGIARRFAGAQVLALDFSRASLGYALRKTRELGIDNIEYRHADILALGGGEERFDLIECSGVLHHMEDPLEGWRILAGLRKPGGLMHIGLYSRLGRRPVARARELIAAEGFAADAAGIRACRAAIRARAGDPQLAAIARNEDFFSMSGCRDLLFHVQESAFDLGEIEAMLGTLGLRFLGFDFPDSGQTLARYRARFADPLDLGAWQRFEAEFPDTFARMYQFWVS